MSALGLFAGGFSPVSYAGDDFVDTVFRDPLVPQASNAISQVTTERKISPSLLNEVQNGEKTSVVVLLRDQADVRAAYTIKDVDRRGWFVYKTLTEHAARTQSDLRAFLTARGVSFKPFWAANMLTADVDRTLLFQIAERLDVARIDSNRPARWIEDEQIAKFGIELNNSAVPEAVEWGVANVNAPGVWALGFIGTGIVIGDLDTGVRWTHDAIKSKYRGWNGVTADHNYNWHDAVHTGGGICGPDIKEPCDDHGHGSHTVGTMVGDDGAGNQIGVAPGAKWIGCRNMNVGAGTPATYTECFQFMIAPTDLAGNNPNPTLRPHVLNNSWSCPPSEGCTTGAELETIIQNTQAAGIFVEVSAGNSGPNCSSVSSPPAIYNESFSTGAISITNALASFSSRGPSTYYTPNILKPNISAPGVNVRSIVGNSDSGYTNLSGTSMAGPHVSGVIALLWSARPALVRDIAATKELLQNTANPDVSLSAQSCGGIASTQIPNNSFGYGRVDALAAFNASATPTPAPSGFESDMATRNTGDGVLLANDLPLLRRIVVGTLTPEPGTSEFQRADSAPATTLGDGVIDAADIAQARRYVAGLDPVRPTGGPVSPTAISDLQRAADGYPMSIVNGLRTMSLRPVISVNGRRVVAEVELDAQGDESASSFTLDYDATRLSNPQITPGGGAASGARLTVNTAEKGRVTILVDSAVEFAKGKRSIAVVSFDISSEASSSETAITFSKVSISDTRGIELKATTRGGRIPTLRPRINLSGSVVTPNGRSARYAAVPPSKAHRQNRNGATFSFGYYPVGTEVINKVATMSAYPRRYRFTSELLDLTGKLREMDLFRIE